MQELIQKNLWNIIITGGAIIIAFTTLSSRVAHVEASHVELESKTTKLEELAERLIVIEEKTNNTREDIVEIKSDIKDIKKHFDVQ